MGKIVTSREFNQNVSAVKRAADDGPVIITDRGEPAYVLMRHEEYKKLTSKGLSMLELLGHVGGEDIDRQSEIPRRRISPRRPVELD